MKRNLSGDRTEEWRERVKLGKKKIKTAISILA